MTTASPPTTARLLLGFASGGLNCLVAFGFIVLAASGDHHAPKATATACQTATAVPPSCAEQAATTPTPEAQDLRELAVAH